MHDLKQLMQALKDEKAEILNTSQPLRLERLALLERLQPLEAELKEIDKEIQAIERPRLGDIDNQLGALAKMLGGR